MKLFIGEIVPEVVIDADEQHHILKVLRMKSGDEISLTDGKGNLAHGTIEIKGKMVTLNPTEIIENTPNINGNLHIAIAPTKVMDRTEFFIEKAIEMGIAEITFLKTDNSERKNIRIDKIKKKALSACKQSLRTHFPKINDLILLSDFLENTTAGSTFVAHCNSKFERSTLNEIKNLNEYTFLIGPEGDFSEREIIQLSEKGIKAVSLGHQRLRTETAGIFVAAWCYAQSFQ